MGRRHWVLAAWSSVLVGACAGAGAEPVGGTVDPFLADRSERAVAFRREWAAAQEEAGKVGRPPAGVTRRRQRELAVAAYGRAIAVWPDAPPVPEILFEAAHFWDGAGIEPEEPGKALEAFERVIRGFSKSHVHVVRALGGKAFRQWEMGDLEGTRATWQKVMCYELPADADAQLREVAREVRADAAKWIAVIDKRRVTGVWEGARGDVTIRVTFFGTDDVKWVERTKRSAVEADLRRAEDRDGKTTLLRQYLPRGRSGERQSVVVGKLERGEDGGWMVTVLPAARETVEEYVPIERVVLREVKAK